MSLVDNGHPLGCEDSKVPLDVCLIATSTQRKCSGLPEKYVYSLWIIKIHDLKVNQSKDNEHQTTYLLICSSAMVGIEIDIDRT